jgi:hypothetical protein
MMSIKSAFKRMIGTQAEDGQAIVLIALFMVVMLAMVGVAIDGGGLFLLWRDAQNAADTAALQAAYDRCTTDDESTWQGVGYKAADINGFDDTDDGDAIGSDFSTDNTVTVKETFLTGTGYVHVIIEAVKPSYFIQLVYRGPLEVKAEAMVYCSRAVDFSDLPGAIALGDCSCPYTEPPGPVYTGGGEDRFDQQGSDYSFTGGTHSNCDSSFNSGGDGGDFIGESPSSVGTTDDHGKATYPTGEDATTNEAATPVPLDPLALDIRMYDLGGAIYDNVAIKQRVDADGGGFDYVDNGGSPYKPANGIEGLLFVDGSVTLQFTDSIGNEGLTIVATGQITGARPKDVSWYYYGWNGEVTDDFGIAARFEGGYYPHLVAFSIMDTRSDCSDPNSANSAIVPVMTADENGNDDLDLVGVLYAPQGFISWSGNYTNGKGALIGWGVSFSGSNISWVMEPSMLPPRAPYMNNAQ